MGASESHPSERSIREAAKTLGVKEEDVQEARESLREGGVTAFVKFITKKEEDWKKQVLKIGVTGLSGSGKSTFINTIRELRVGDPNAAETGVEETTLEPTRYRFPGCDQVEIWEVPGVNTPRFPKETYIEKIKFDSYDFFLILSSERFRADDSWLGKEATERKKKFFYVKTKVDQDITNEKCDHPAKAEEDILNSLKSNVAENLKNSGFPYDPLIFLIGRDFGKYDIGKLKQQIKKDCPALKRDQLVLAFNAITKQEIEEKAAVLAKRIWHRGAISAVVNCVRIPGTGIAVDLSLIKKELQYYYDQLGLSDEGLARTAELSGCDKELLEKVREMGYPKAQLATTSITRGLLAVGAAAASVAALTVLTGGVSAAVAGVAVAADVVVIAGSYANVHYTLSQALDGMKNAAMMVADAAVTKSIPEVVTS